MSRENKETWRWCVSGVVLPSKYEKAYVKPIAVFTSLVNAEDFVKKCIGREQQGRILITEGIPLTKEEAVSEYIHYIHSISASNQIHTNIETITHILIEKQSLKRVENDFGLELYTVVNPEVMTKKGELDKDSEEQQEMEL